MTQPSSSVDSGYSWFRLGLSVLYSTISSVGIWAIVVVIPAVQSDFEIGRGLASVAYATMMIGFAAGNALVGRFVDRMGIAPVAIVSAICLAAGFFGASICQNIWQLCAFGLLTGVGAATAFAPLIADISHWFKRRRGFAVAATASGNYIAGAIWPPVINYFLEDHGWRGTYVGISIFCLVTLIPIAILLRRRASWSHDDLGSATDAQKAGLAMSTGSLQILLIAAAIACCVAMSMPQVHIVAYSADLGYGVARGAEMLALMLAGGVISRLAFGYLSDYLGGLKTCLLASSLQCLALLAFLPAESLSVLYVVAFLFGLSQGGIVPSYAMIIREFMPASQAAQRVGLVISASIVGMALGGWMTGWIHDMTGSYDVAFLNGIAWNVFNIGIIAMLTHRTSRRQPLAA